MEKKLVLRIAALISGISGVIILIGVIYPILSYNSTFTPKYNQLLSPVSENSLGASSLQQPSPGPGSTALDYSKASNWFPGGASKENFTSSKVEYFTVSIPKLKIDKAAVAIGGEDLSEHIIQYPGTA